MIRLLIFIATLSFCVLASAEEVQVNEIYETYNPAARLIPVLEPMLGPEDRITAFRNKLLVKAPRARQDKILDILKDIDRPLRNLLIQVRFSDNLSQDMKSQQMEVRYRDGSTGVRVQATPDDSNKVVVYKGSSQDDKIQVRVMDQNVFSTRDDNTLSQVRVLEGEQGFIRVGEEQPRTGYVFLQPNGIGTTTEYHMVGNGFYVIPQIVKDRIRLELYTTNQRVKAKNPNVVQSTEAQSVLVVQPDIWTPFAGAGAVTRSSSSAFTASTRDLKQGNQGLEIKVTILE